MRLADQTDTASGFQVTFRHHVPEEERLSETDPLTIDVTYDRTELEVNDTVTATARVVNNLDAVAPMVILDLPVPAGFAIEPKDFDALIAAGTIAKYQVTPRSTIIYLRQIMPNQPLLLRYRLRATMPVKIQVPTAQAYLYYDPDVRGESEPVRMIVARGQRVSEYLAARSR